MMTSRHRWVRRAVIWGGGATVVGALVLAWVVPARSQDSDLDVLKVIPHNYKLLIENQYVRVIEARIPAGTQEPPHRHLRGVSVSMSDYTIEHLAQTSKQWERSQRRLGSVYWSESSVHQTRNVGTTPSHTIRIELKF